MTRKRPAVANRNHMLKLARYAQRCARPTTGHLAAIRCLTSTAGGRNETGSRTGEKRIIFSGIQPTGIPHLGNYLGALSNWVKLQRGAGPADELIFSIVGWHALTLPQKPNELLTARMDMMAVLLAVGIDPTRSIIFHQDQNQSHAELAWILSCLTPMGKLKRMTTWRSRLVDARNAKDDSEVDESMLNVGLFTYPILQAADILAYRATHVPVGDDQRQHLELSRDIADTFNGRFGQTFPLPKSVVVPSSRILSLKDPTSKMSKSAHDVRSRILLTDSAAEISAKIRAAVTDSTTGITYDPVHRPGTSNLLTILAACTGGDVVKIATRYEGKRHGDLKVEVADAVEELIKGPRKKFKEIRSEHSYLEGTAEDGARRARERAAITLTEVRRKIGLS